MNRSAGADMIGKQIVLAAVAIIAMDLNAAEAVAQSYPTRPIKMILPFPPGGPIDTMGRLVAQQMSASLGQNVYIENRAGGGSSIGMRAAATADPDGYTLLFASSGPLAITPALYKNLDYDPNKNFAPVATVSSGPMVLVVPPTLPVKSVQELVAYAKANPGKLNYGATIGTPPHLAWGQFTMLTGTDIVYVPYKGAEAAFTDLVAGQIQMNFDATGSLLPLIREGKLKALAVSSTSRNPDLPDVPTMVESGIDFPHELLDRGARSGGHATRHHRQAQRHYQCRPGLGRDESKPGEIPGRGKTRLAAGLRGVSRGGDEKMG
jgi:tripartite-type tricarboxylate transporter receptor subunit TctC